MDNFYASYPVESGGSGSSVVTIYANVAAFPVSAPIGSLAVDASTGNLFEFNGTSWVLIAGPGGATSITIGALDSQAANANGLALVANVLSAQSADATHPGLVNTTTQSFGGNKTFTGTVGASNLSGTNTGDQTITLTGSVTGSGTGSFATIIANGAISNAMISNSTIDLTTKVTGVLPLIHGGTNNALIPNNNRFVVTAFGQMAEAAAIAPHMAVVTDATGLPTSNVTTAQEIGFVNGVTSSIQTQLNAKHNVTIDRFTLSSTDITNKHVTLTATPTSPTSTLLTVVNGPLQDYGVDYTVSGAILSWSGLWLDGVLVAGDKLIVQFE